MLVTFKHLELKVGFEEANVKTHYVFDSISAGFINPGDYNWYRYTGKTPMKFEHPDRKRNRKHNLVLAKGDLFGLREKRTGGWNLVREDMQHVIFKMHDYDMDLIFKRAKLTKDTPDKQTGKPGRSRTRGSGPTPRFKKRGVSATREKTQVNKADYQWRVVMDDKIMIRTPANKPKFELKKNQKVGLRFVNSAKGGFLVLENGTRARISTKSYDEISDASYIMDPQPKGTIDIDSEELRKEKVRAAKDKKKLLEKPKSVRRPKKVEEEPEEESRKVRITRRKPGSKIPRPSRIVEDEELSLDEEPKAQRKSTLRKRRRIQHGNRGNIKDIDQDVRLEDEYKETVKDDMVEPELDIDETPKRTLRKRRIRPSQVAEKENAKAKKAAKKDMKETVKEANDFDAGDVVVFTKDKKQREYLILEERPFGKSDNVTEYLIYNLTEEPDYIQKFMQSNRGTKLSNLGKVVRKIKDMSEYEEYPEMFDISTLSPYK